MDEQPHLHKNTAKNQNEIGHHARVTAKLHISSKMPKFRFIRRIR
jgi:hypothetical protein